MFVATHWPEIEIYSPEWELPHLDKLVHGILYAGWVVMWWRILSIGGRQVGSATINWLLLGGVGYAVFDEVTQAIVDRTPTTGDFAADIVGMAVAVSILQFRQRKRSSR